MKNKTTSYFSSDFTLGILGGGQLGKMLLYETRKFDITTHVLDPNADAPARLACNKFIIGDLMDFQSVYQFGKQVDLLTIEIENVNIEALEQLEKEGLKIYPSVESLKIIQNKALQKYFYKQNEIPTADFMVFKSIDDLKTQIIQNKISLPFVWKSAQFGYDGNGVKIVQTIDDLKNLPNNPCIAEKLIPFETELSVIVARNPIGDIQTYPVVEMEFHPEANQVEYVLCPARINENISQKAQEIAINVAKKLQIVGLLAVEMFLTKDKEILINEVAPRPHNSGHYSIEASYTNQFEQHLRAILNLPLGNTESKVAAVMVNLVGQENYYGNVFYKNIDNILKLSGVTPHIYGKKQTRPFRKMGHITVTNTNLQKARQIAQIVKNTICVQSYTE